MPVDASYCPGWVGGRGKGGELPCSRCLRRERCSWGCTRRRPPPSGPPGSSHAARTLPSACPVTKYKEIALYRTVWRFVNLLVLRIRDVYPGYRIRICSIPDPESGSGVQKGTGSGSAALKFIHSKSSMIQCRGSGQDLVVPIYLAFWIRIRNLNYGSGTLLVYKILGNLRKKLNNYWYRYLRGSTGRYRITFFNEQPPQKNEDQTLIESAKFPPLSPLL